MSHLQGIRNLRDLYSIKYAEKINDNYHYSNSQISNRLKLPAFPSARPKYPYNNANTLKQ